MSTNDVPRFFSSGSDFVDKAELATSGKLFCIMDVTDTDTVHGLKWYIQIFVDGEDELRTMTFSHGDVTKSKREKEFIQLAANPQYLPVHACTLKKYSFEGKSGYRIAARSGAGACACSPGEQVIDTDALLLPASQPTPAPAANTLENAPASPKQYATIGKFSALLNRDIDTPETYGEAASLIERLEQDYKAMTAQLNRPVKTEKGVPVR